MKKKNVSTHAKILENLKYIKNPEQREIFRKQLLAPSPAKKMKTDIMSKEQIEAFNSQMNPDKNLQADVSLINNEELSFSLDLSPFSDSPLTSNEHSTLLAIDESFGLEENMGFDIFNDEEWLNTVSDIFRNR